MTTPVFEIVAIYPTPQRVRDLEAHRNRWLFGADCVDNRETAFPDMTVSAWAPPAHARG